MAFIGGLVSLFIGFIIIGLVAGYSIILYATQVAILSGHRTPIKRSLHLIAGVASALILLVISFLFLQPETLNLHLTASFFAERRTNLIDAILGLVFIVTGTLLFIFGIKRSHTPRPKTKQHTQGRGAASAALFSLGFARTVTSVSGIAALILGVRTALHASDGVFLGLIIMLAVLLAAALLPYVFILGAKLWWPNIFLVIERFLTKLRTIRPYRSIGVALTVIGFIFLVLSTLPVKI